MWVPPSNAPSASAPSPWRPSAASWPPPPSPNNGPTNLPTCTTRCPPRCAKTRSVRDRPAIISSYSCPRNPPMKPRPQKKKQPTNPTPTSPNLRDQILADFTTLRVPVTADQLDAALTDAEQNGRSHLEFLHRLLTDQAGLRRQRRIERLIKDANFREALPLSTFDWNFNPAIPRLVFV